jgi:hypothetical protein
MNKYVLIGLIVFVLISAIISLIVFKPNVFKNPKELELTYKMSAGIPFKRVIEIEDESIVELVRNYVSKDENTGGKVGAPVYMTYVFKGLKEGTTTITYKEVNIDDSSDAMSVDKNIVTVDKDGNIKIMEE